MATRKSRKQARREFFKNPKWLSLGSDGSVIASVRASTKAEAKEILKRHGEPVDFVVKAEENK